MSNDQKWTVVVRPRATTPDDPRVLAGNFWDSVHGLMGTISYEIHRTSEGLAFHLVTDSTEHAETLADWIESEIGAGTSVKPASFPPELAAAKRGARFSYRHNRSFPLLTHRDEAAIRTKETPSTATNQYHDFLNRCGEHDDYTIVLQFVVTPVGTPAHPVVRPLIRAREAVIDQLGWERDWTAYWSRGVDPYEPLPGRTAEEREAAADTIEAQSNTKGYRVAGRLLVRHNDPDEDAVMARLFRNDLVADLLTGFYHPVTDQGLSLSPSKISLLSPPNGVVRYSKLRADMTARRPPRTRWMWVRKLCMSPRRTSPVMAPFELGNLAPWPTDDGLDPRTVDAMTFTADTSGEKPLPSDVG